MIIVITSNFKNLFSVQTLAKKSSAYTVVLESFKDQL